MPDIIITDKHLTLGVESEQFFSFTCLAILAQTFVHVLNCNYLWHVNFQGK